ncbi:MAG: FapA family protein, partial [Eubacteriales bacterium]|nr:FapA family protein [Eubacteriales bacterium]
MDFKKDIKKLEVKEDGAYFLVDYNDLNVKKEIMNIIKKYRIKDVDYLAIESALSKKERHILISTDVEQFTRNEKAEINISEDGLMATAKFTQPLFDGKKLTQAAILAILAEKNIKYGINFNAIEEFLEYRDYDKEYILAMGEEPKEGKDGYIKFHIDLNEKKPLPKILEDGSLDYKSLKLFEEVKENDLLAEKIDGSIGKYGINIFGREVLPKLPEEAPNLPKGKNTFISKDGKMLFAKNGGRVVYNDNKISILPILELNNGVNNSTGNIKFSGNIIINGDVLTGFSVEANGDIEINGSVEGANIIADGNIRITKGVQGYNSANLYSKKDINAQFIENAQVFAEENIIANSILHSKIKCGGHLRLIGRKSIIIGGKVIVGGDIIVKYVGSPMSNNTEINIGVSPKVLERYDELVKEIKEKYEKYERLEKIITFLSKKDMDKLSKEKKQLFSDSIKEKMEIKKRLSTLKRDISIIRPLFTKRMGKLDVKT